MEDCKSYRFHIFRIDFSGNSNDCVLNSATKRSKEAMFGELQYFEEQSYFEKHKYGEIYYEGQWHKIEFFAFLNVDAYDSVIYNPYINGENER